MNESIKPLQSYTNQYAVDLNLVFSIKGHLKKLIFQRKTSNETLIHDLKVYSSSLKLH